MQPVRSPALTTGVVGVLVLLLGGAGWFTWDLLVGPASLADRAEELEVIPSSLTGGVPTDVTFAAGSDMSVLIPYLVRDQSTRLWQNSTILDLHADLHVTLELLPPPRSDEAVFLIGELGRTHFPLRQQNESWTTWRDRGAAQSPDHIGVTRLTDPDGGDHPVLSHSATTGGEVGVRVVPIHRPMGAGLTVEDGGLHSTGIVSGKTVHNWLDRITDDTPSLTSPDRAEGYLERWLGNANPAYEDAMEFVRNELESHGLRTEVHRDWSVERPEAVNVCGYKDGTVYPDEWLVFGAHFDIAPLVDPAIQIITGERTYGTRTGAYDNTAGSSMVLTTAAAMSQMDTRRTMVFCFWSSEELGKRGSTAWTENLDPDITVTNYVNLDMAGVNWPGGTLPPNRNGPTEGEGRYPALPDRWPMRVYIGPQEDDDSLEQPAMVGLSAWIGAGSLNIAAELSELLGDPHESWSANDHPGVIIYESSSTSSDHASFQDNLGTVTVGFGGLVDGYDCYHQLCDTLEEMETWMENENGTGEQNLVDSLDIITWWAAHLFLHLDAEPVLNELA